MGKATPNTYDKTIDFDKLPVDVLFIIFDLLDFKCLAALATSCRRLYNVINEEYLKSKSWSLLATNQFSIKVQNRSYRFLTPIEKYWTNYRWKKKFYQEKRFLNSREKFQPWLFLKQKELYVAQGQNIHCFQRTTHGIAIKPTVSFRGHTDDISRFLVRDNLMISCSNDGTICCWNTDMGRVCFKATNDVNWNERAYVDWSGRVIAVGFNKLGIVKLLSLGKENFQFERCILQDDRLWSVALNEGGTLCCIGSAGYRSSPLKIYDLNKNVVTLAVPEKYKLGAAVFHTIWETPQTLISGSYDTYIRLWDLRTGNCVREWGDPYDSAVYSLATDGHCTIVAGTARHGRVTLWDKRLSRCVQMYYMMADGPVYSVDFDPTFMFVALESSLHVVNFNQARPQSYTNLRYPGYNRMIR